MTESDALSPFRLDELIKLDPCPGWPNKAVHLFDRQQALALLAAKAIRRPLLVRGEPGCGKTQLARAAAQVLEMPLTRLVVNERTETEDLFWQFDALQRLSDANVGKVRENHDYLTPGPLWWALDPASAEDPAFCTVHRPYRVDKPDAEPDFSNGVLLLIDEIDKADRAIPNSLLEALGNYSFQVPYTGQQVELGGQPPLIVITSNDEQSLPPAFERRCLVLNLTLPADRDAFVEQLARRGKALYRDQFEDHEIFEQVAGQLWEKRETLRKAGDLRLPGQAEYLDHLAAIQAIRRQDPGRTAQQISEELAQLTYGKYGG